MEGVKGYSQSKGYQRLNGGGRKRKLQLVVLVSPRRRRFWRIKLTPARLKLKLLFSPKKFLVGLRDAYVDMMMNIATTRMIGSAFGGDGLNGFGMRSTKEYDEGMIVEINKSIVTAQRRLVPRGAAWISSLITCRR
ncbi:hypothetical protein Pfo_017439 [Paulownia fortunei]|nr:hypothetical protein Pfo_017439 [Paulownia fortunei]